MGDLQLNVAGRQPDAMRGRSERIANNSLGCVGEFVSHLPKFEFIG